MIGDGSSDLATKSEVDLFVGYGGVIARQAVQAEADIFLRCPSLASILPLAAGRRGWEALRGTAHEAVYRKGMAMAAQSDSLCFRDAAFRARFIREFEDII